MPDVIDVGLLDHVARRLYFDIGDPVQLADLAAVAVTRLAWRDGPLEDWHAVPYRRISNAEMMRANAATTRLVRDHLTSGIAESTSSTVATADLLVSACGLVADQNRRLPDGRSVGSLAPDARQRDLFDDHVRAFADRCAQLVVGFGGREVLALLACHAATYCWRWWLAPAWPRRVAEFIRRLDNPSRWPDEYMTNHVARLVTCAPDGPDHDLLRRQLLEGPDLMDGPGAAYCLGGGLRGIRPQDCGLRPVPHDLLSPDYVDLVAGLIRFGQ